MIFGDENCLRKGQGRDKRLRKASINSLLMIIIKGFSILISLMYVPLLLNSLTPSNYGIWLTLTSFVSWIALFDIGLGNGLRNKLSEALAKNDIQRAKDYVSTAYGAIVVLVFLLTIIFVCIYNFIPWYTLLGADSSIQDLNSLVLVVFTAFVFNFLLSLLNSIINALQLPALSSAIATIAQLLSFLIVVILVKEFNITSLFVLGSVISIVPPFVLFVMSIVLFCIKFRKIAPSLGCFKKDYISEILSLGVKFFVIQIITIILYQSNNLIITQVIDNVAVVEYNVAYKYMNMLVMFFNIMITPMWSATTEAFAKGEIQWIKSVNKKLAKIAFLFSVFGLLMVLLSNFVYKIWLHSNEVNISFSTTVLLYVYAIAMMFYGVYGYIINGMGKLTIQIIFTSVSAILYVPCAVFMGKLLGLNGILIVYAMVTIINVVWSKIQLTRILNRTAKGIWNR